MTAGVFLIASFCNLQLLFRGSRSLSPLFPAPFEFSFFFSPALNSFASFLFFMLLLFSFFYQTSESLTAPRAVPFFFHIFLPLKKSSNYNRFSFVTAAKPSRRFPLVFGSIILSSQLRAFPLFSFYFLVFSYSNYTADKTLAFGNTCMEIPFRPLLLSLSLRSDEGQTSFFLSPQFSKMSTPFFFLFSMGRLLALPLGSYFSALNFRHTLFCAPRGCDCTSCLGLLYRFSIPPPRLSSTFPTHTYGLMCVLHTHARFSCFPPKTVGRYRAHSPIGTTEVRTSESSIYKTTLIDIVRFRSRIFLQILFFLLRDPPLLTPPPPLYFREAHH